MKFFMAVAVNSNECPVCFDPLTGYGMWSKKIVTGPCNHFFHEGCIKKWLRGSGSVPPPKTCPICVGDIAVDDLKPANKKFKAHVLQEENKEPLLAVKIPKLDPRKVKKALSEYSCCYIQ